MPEIIEKLAGRAPATKVGGMRVSQPRKTSESNASDNTTKSEDLSVDDRMYVFLNTTALKASKANYFKKIFREKLNQSNVTTLISGTPVKVI